MLQVVRSPQVYDVCIVGSGAAGGTAAKVLTDARKGYLAVEEVPHGWRSTFGTILLE